MEAIKSWISGICTVSLMISVIKSFLPKNTAGNTMNIICSLLIVVVIIAPIKKIDFNFLEFEISESERALSDKVEDVVYETEKLTDIIIEKELCEYICNKTDLDLKDIEITCDKGEIIEVVLYCQNEDVIKILENEYGVRRGMITVVEENDDA